MEGLSDLENALNVLGVKEDEIQSFDVNDTFNNNSMRGFLCRRADHRYGALFLTHINDVASPQIIYATPKLHYPFDKNGDYHWPDCRDVKYYEKLDGTNILAYHYTDDKGIDCVTFKTRLTPVVRDMGFGVFESMLREYMTDNQWVANVINENPQYNLSFELFGSRNPITVRYDVPLSLNLIFGVRRNDAAVRPPSDLLICNGVLIPSVINGNGQDRTQEYNKLRSLMSGRNGSGEDDSFVIEGMVMYANVGEPSWKMFKCKPEEIEKIHWSASGSIPRVALSTTALNVFESAEDPSIDYFITLLKEEYPQSMIDKAMIKIEKAWEAAKEKIYITKNINDIWILAKQTGLDITKDKAATMRFMSQYFPKSMMRKVGSIILKQSGLI